jgi:hypothetical protein
MTSQDDSLPNDKETIKVENDLLNCKNCGFEPVAAYCPKCGQRTQERFSLKYIIRELFSVFELEKGFLKNIVELTLRPAKIIEEYINGKTKDFYSPFGYFFVSMTIFLFISLNFPISSDFNMTGEQDNSEDLFIFNVKEREKQIKDKYSEKMTAISSQITVTDSLRWLEYLTKNNVTEEMLTLQQFRETEINLQNDSTFVIEENQKNSIYSFVYTTISHQLLDLQTEKENELKNLEKKSLSGQIATYTIFYLTPLYLAFIVSLFYSKKKLYFTEHLITQTFITTQLIIFITSLVGVFRVLYWISYFFDKESSVLNDINIILAALLWILGVFGTFGYYFYVMRRLYKQSRSLTFFKCMAISIILFFVAFMCFIIFDVIFVE